MAIITSAGVAKSTVRTVLAADLAHWHFVVFNRQRTAAMTLGLLLDLLASEFLIVPDGAARRAAIGAVQSRF